MFVVFDAGGTKTRITVSEGGRVFVEPVVFSTEQDFSLQLKEMRRVIEKLTNKAPISAIAGGVAGPFNESRNRLIKSPNLPDWVGINLKEELENEFDTKVFLENDTAMVGLGEATAGAGCGYSIVVYITVSTGVGGVRIIRGKIDEKKIGFEPGHQIINFDGINCTTCDGQGHLESYISGGALERLYGIKPYEIHDKKIWEEEARLLAVGLNNVSVFWSPDVIVLGGSMIVGDPGIEVSHVERHLKKILTIFPNPPILKKATLGDFGGLFGSLHYIQQKGSDTFYF